MGSPAPCPFSPKLRPHFFFSRVDGFFLRCQSNVGQNKNKIYLNSYLIFLQYEVHPITQIVVECTNSAYRKCKKNAFKRVFLLITKRIFTLELRYLQKVNINVYIADILVPFTCLQLFWFLRYAIFLDFSELLSRAERGPEFCDRFPSCL